MRRYPEYKKSSVEWIGEIPKDWQVLKVKHVGSTNPSKTNPKTACLKDTLVVFLPMERVHTDGTIDQELKLPYSQLKNGYTYFEENDVLIAKVTPCFENGKIILVKNLATPVGFGSTEFIVIRPNTQKVFPPFLFYLLYNEPLRSIGKHFMTSAVGLKRVPTEFVENFQIPIPAYQEQTQIANFLDCKTGHIDELIRIKERRIELLQEQRTTLVNQAMTTGLDPNVEVKPSEVERIGEIPKDQEVTRLKYICELIVDCEHKTAPTQETGYPLIRTPNIGIGHLILDGVNRVSEAIYREWSRRTIPQSGDLILAREAPVGNVAIIPTDLKVCLGQRTVLIRPDKNKVYAMFLVYLMLGYETQVKLLGHSTGAIVHRLNMTDIRNLELPRLPSLPIQHKIANFLDCKTGQIDELVSTERRKIELLKEYRQSLIFEAVTGKIDVRSEA